MDLIYNDIKVIKYYYIILFYKMNNEVEPNKELEIPNNIDYLIYINLVGDKTIINAPIGINIQDMLILLIEKRLPPRLQASLIYHCH